jgi:hypothetical protein
MNNAFVSSQSPNQQGHQATMSYQNISIGGHPMTGHQLQQHHHIPHHQVVFSNAGGARMSSESLGHHLGQMLPIAYNQPTAEPMLRLSCNAGTRPIIDAFLASPSPQLTRNSSGIQSSASRRASVKQEETTLGVDFTPGPWHVVSELDGAIACAAI